MQITYVSKPKTMNRTGGHFFLSNEANVPGNNGTVLNTAHIIKHVMSSATESELAAVYIMAKEAVYIRIILEEMGQKNTNTHCKQTTRYQMQCAMARFNQSAQRQ